MQKVPVPPTTRAPCMDFTCQPQVIKKKLPEFSVQLHIFSDIALGRKWILAWFVSINILSLKS
jgi:hypothetical protein